MRKMPEKEAKKIKVHSFAIYINILKENSQKKRKKYG